MKKVLQTSLLSLSLSAYGLNPPILDASSGIRAISELGNQVHEPLSSLLASARNNAGGRGRRRSIYSREADPEANLYDDGSHALTVEKRQVLPGFGFGPTPKEIKARVCKGKLNSVNGQPVTQKALEGWNRYCGFPLDKPARRSLYAREAEAAEDRRAQRKKNIEASMKEFSCKWTSVGCKKKEYVVREAGPEPHYYEERYAYAEPSADEYNLYEREAHAEPGADEYTVYEREAHAEPATDVYNVHERDADAETNANELKFYERAAYAEPGADELSLYERDSEAEPGVDEFDLHERDAYAEPSMDESDLYERDAYLDLLYPESN